MQYEPTLESLREHAVPDWFHDAKLGIFIHWGLYSVPGWAPLTGEFKEVVAKEGWASWFARNPYAEWYLNSIRIKGSPSYQYHVNTYGEGFSYDDFVPLFNEAIEKWDSNDWADLFQKVGARYVVLTAKHHDGFLLWPSEHPSPKKEKYFAKRDLVGELAQVVRAHGLRMGLYYSGGLDWTFNERAIRDIVDLFATIPQGPDYVQYADRHWYELIDRYKPTILWNDIGYPATANLNKLFAYYYNKVPDGLVNDRFTQVNLATSGIGKLLKYRAGRALFSFAWRWAVPRFSVLPTTGHWDFRTPEYASFRHITKQKWESTRGIGYSFGYNRNEGPENLLSVNELVRLLVDIVSKNGNLLLNVGPMADGTIPELQRERLLGLGQWLEVDGEAIFDTRPWVRAEGSTVEDIAVRFMKKGDILYAILLDTPKRSQVVIKSLYVDENTIVHLLGYDRALSWKQEGKNLTIALPEDMPESPAYALRIAPGHQFVSGLGYQ